MPVRTNASMLRDDGKRINQYARVFNTNALLFILVTAELMRSGCQIIQFRCGA